MARNVQEKRFNKMKIHVNADMNSRQIRKSCTVDSDSNDLLETAMERFGLSARAHSRILKIARTIADLDESLDIKSSHVAEAIQYRTLDRRFIK
jgi:magnesium chelatase family protein